MMQSTELKLNNKDFLDEKAMRTEVLCMCVCVCVQF